MNKVKVVAVKDFVERQRRELMEAVREACVAAHVMVPAEASKALSNDNPETEYTLCNKGCEMAYAAEVTSSHEGTDDIVTIDLSELHADATHIRVYCEGKDD